MRISYLDIQNGALPHWGFIARNFLNETFPNRWIGRDDLTSWPHLSPDINSLDFFYEVISRIESMPYLLLTAMN